MRTFPGFKQIAENIDEELGAEKAALLEPNTFSRSLLFGTYLQVISNIYLCRRPVSIEGLERQRSWLDPFDRSDGRKTIKIGLEMILKRQSEFKSLKNPEGRIENMGQMIEVMMCVLRRALDEVLSQ